LYLKWLSATPTTLLGLTMSNSRHIIRSMPAADEPVFDSGEISKMPADAPKAWDDPEPRRPFVVVKKKIRVRRKTREQYEELEQKTREEFRRRDIGYYRGRVPAGSATHRKADLIRAFCRDNGISPKGFVSLAPEECTDVYKTQGHRQRAKPVAPVLGYCHECHKSLPPDSRADAKFCPTGGCKQAHYRRRKAREDAEAALFGAVPSIAANTMAGLQLPESEADYRAYVLRLAKQKAPEPRKLTPAEQAEYSRVEAEMRAYDLWAAKHENKTMYRGSTQRGF
jgi:hypothetical protein